MRPLRPLLQGAALGVLRGAAPGLARCAVLGTVALAGLTACSSSTGAPRAPAATSAASTSTQVPASSTAPTTTAAAPTTVPASTTAPVRPPTSASVPRTGSAPHAAPTDTTVSRLPVGYPTGSARQVITVVAPDRASTTATLQAWKRSGSGWARVGPAVTAHLGSDGSTDDASESRSATPVGSFTLTRAFGHDSDPGTRLPYTRTTPDDWWISQPGALYNTLQHCSSRCPFTQGNPNEHLYYETPAYDHAVVIDYNTANAPGGVKQGAGSAFFLHVSEGVPTAGCVSIPSAELTRVMRWLDPAAHPRIVIDS